MPNNFDYTTGIPAAGNNPSSDQPDMQTNTNSINSLINVDHIGFNTNGSGIHKQVTFPMTTNDPGLGDGTSVLFAKNSTGNPWLFFKNGVDTFNVLGPIVDGVTGANGYAWMGGLLVQWGTVTFAGNDDHETGTYAFNTSPNIDFPTAIYAIVTGLQVASTAETVSSNTIAIRDFSLSQFRWVFNSSSSTGSSRYPGFYWVAIGT